MESESNQNFCYQCGHMLTPEQKFCPECGTRVPGRNPEAVEQEKTEIKEAVGKQLKWAAAMMLVYSIPFLVIGIYVAVAADSMTDLIWNDPNTQSYIEQYGLSYDEIHSYFEYAAFAYIISSVCGIISAYLCLKREHYWPALILCILSFMTGTAGFIALFMGIMAFWMIFVVAFGILVCAKGLQNGLERVTKVMMIALLVIMVVLAVNSLFMPGAKEGLSFFLVPDFKRMEEVGVVNTLVSAMNQAFFTLSLGIGAMSIFGSYIGKEHSLLGESVRIVILDTFVAITAGLIIFPACFTYGVDQTSGPSLIFITLPNIFANMALGRLWGTLFFLFMAFAALSTVLAVFENIICCGMELTGCSRKKSSLVNLVLITALSLPCVLGYNLWAWDGFAVFGGAVLDFEDFLVSNLFLPLGSLVYLLFCVTKYGWGWDNYKKEVNTGKGLKMHDWMRGYLTYVLPVIVLFIFAFGIYDKFFA